MQNKIQHFLANPFISRIASEPRWTITSTIDNKKKPMDAYLFMHEGRLAGASFTRGHNPLTDLGTLLNWLDVQNMHPTNLTYYLNAEQNRQLILDIESSCDSALKDAFIENLPWEYIETSMSGKGIHLGLTLPSNHSMRFDTLSVLKHPENTYEYLMNNHFVTFTMNQTDQIPNLAKSDEDLLGEIMPMYQTWLSKQTTAKEFVLSDKPDIPEEEYISRMLANVSFGRTLADYNNNHSRYEFGCGCLFLFKFKMLLTTTRLKDISFDENMVTWLIYQALSNYLEYRPKHNEFRRGIPYLLYQAKNIVAMHYDQPLKKGDQR